MLYEYSVCLIQFAVMVSRPAARVVSLVYATSINPHTNSKRTLKENADGVYHACKKMLKRQQAYIQQMDID